MNIPLSFKCGVCGGSCKASISTDNGTITTTCPVCQNHINLLEKQIGDLEDEVYELTREGAA